jgi:hypothetical protein
MSGMTFTAHGQPLQVVSQQTTDGWTIKLQNALGQQVSPVVFKVGYEVAADAALQSGEDLVAGLMVQMKSEAVSGQLKLFRPEQLGRPQQT